MYIKHISPQICITVMQQWMEIIKKKYNSAFINNIQYNHDKYLQLHNLNAFSCITVMAKNNDAMQEAFSFDWQKGFFLTQIIASVSENLRVLRNTRDEEEKTLSTSADKEWSKNKRVTG